MLAANIANADTPHYKARDLDFGKAMQAAMANSSPTTANTLTQTNPRHLAASSSLSGLNAYVTLRVPTQNNRDGNTVDMDIERNAFTENALHYEMAATMAQGDIKSLLSVLQG